MPIYAFKGLVPIIDSEAFVHPTAVLIGDVWVGPGCYVGPGASLRGDFGRIILGAGSNLQDNCIMHTFPGAECVVAENCHIGHGVVLHGCRIEYNAMIGINSVVMDGAVIGANSIIGAMSFVKSKLAIPPGVLVYGNPAQVVRSLTDEELDRKVAGTVEYKNLARTALTSLIECTPLTTPDKDRRQLL